MSYCLFIFPVCKICMLSVILTQGCSHGSTLGDVSLAVQSLCGFCCVQPAVLRCTLSSQCSPSSVCSRSAPSAGGKAPNDCFAFKTQTLCCRSDHNTEEVTQPTFLCRWSELPHIWTDFHDQLKTPHRNSCFGLCQLQSLFSTTRCCTLEYSVSLIVVNLRGTDT